MCDHPIGLLVNIDPDTGSAMLATILASRQGRSEIVIGINAPAALYTTGPAVPESRIITGFELLVRTFRRWAVAPVFSEIFLTRGG